MEVTKRLEVSQNARPLLLEEAYSLWSAEQIKESLNNASQYFYYELSNPTISSIILWQNMGDQLQLLMIYTGIKFHRQGLGSMLLKKSLQMLQQELKSPPPQLALEVSSLNKVALLFYLSLGFTQTDVRKNYYGKKNDALIMTHNSPTLI